MKSLLAFAIFMLSSVVYGQIDISDATVDELLEEVMSRRDGRALPERYCADQGTIEFVNEFFSMFVCNSLDRKSEWCTSGKNYFRFDIRWRKGSSNSLLRELRKACSKFEYKGTTYYVKADDGWDFAVVSSQEQGANLCVDRGLAFLQQYN